MDNEFRSNGPQLIVTIHRHAKNWPALVCVMTFLAIFGFLLQILTAQQSLALEIYRNSKRYDIKAQLPDGYDFQVDKIDRKFQINALSGSLRLIQDNDYDTCNRLVDDRRENWIKYGYIQSADRYVSSNECSIRIVNPTEEKSANSFYIHSQGCDCFIALQFSYANSNVGDYLKFAPSIVASIRKNNSGPPGPAIVAPVASAIVEATDPGAARQESKDEAALPPQLMETLDKIKSLSCAEADLTGDAGEAAILLSAWNGENIDDLGRKLNLPHISADIAAAGGKLILNGPTIRRLAQNQAASIAAINRYLIRYGPELCPIISEVFASGVDDLAMRQQRVHSFYHSYIASAQQLAAFHGCFSEVSDGVFGPVSRIAWNRMRSGLGLPLLADDRFPTLGDVIDAAAVSVSSGACDPPERGGPQAPALPFLGKGDVYESWVRQMTPSLGTVLDGFARSGQWTSWTSRLALSTTHAAYHAPEGTKELLLARMYEQGIGVNPDSAAALYWKGQSHRETSFYSQYLAGLTDPDKAATFVRAIMKQRRSISYDTGSINAGSIRVPSSASLSIAEIADLVRLCTLVIRQPAAFEAVKREADPPYLFIIADRLLAGASLDGKAPRLAAELLEIAVKENAYYAASRLALLYRYGLGVPEDRRRAYELAGMAANGNEPYAMLLLATMTEEDRPGDVDQILGFYGRLLEEEKNDTANVHFPVEMITNRIMKQGVAFGSPAGKALIEEAGNAPVFAKALANMYLCTECGGVVDLVEGARWLRQWSKDDNEQDGASFFLYQLLTANPQLKISPDETSQIMKAGIKMSHAASGPLLDSGSDVGLFLTQKIAGLRLGYGNADIPKPLNSLLDNLCSGSTAGDYCDKADKYLASGMFGGDLVSVGMDRLKKRNSYALIDALAAYGDFSGALALGRKFEGNDDFASSFMVVHGVRAASDIFQDVDFLRSSTFRRLIARRGASDLADLPPDFAPFLRFLAAHGDEEAKEYVSILGVSKTTEVAISRDPHATQSAFDRLSALGGISRAFINAAQENSLAMQSSGQTRGALEMELTAVAAEMQLDNITAIGAGSLQGALTQACHLSRASERAFALGSHGVAMVFAKDSINILQQVRGKLVKIPEKLQGCFRDLVSDNYRWLADLMVQENRLGEAQFVLGLLKDFENLEFVEKDPEFVGTSFQLVPYSPAEELLKSAISKLQLATVSNASRTDELRAQLNLRSLTAAETRELADLEARLKSANAQHRQGMAEILAAADAVNQVDNTTVLANLDKAQSLLSGDTNGQIAVIHYLVLPDRLNIILTTHSERRRYIVTQWEGQPFSETRLNAEIAKLHDVLSDDRSNPLPQSQRLYNLLIQPIANDIAAAGAKQLLLSLDRRLRYIPFNALYDGHQFLVERYDTSLLTNSGYELSGSASWGAQFAGLGTTQAGADYEALPGVALELSGIVKGPNNAGLLAGNVRLDKDFNRQTLERALNLGASSPGGVGIVHIASHFMLGNTDADSFLILGTGEHLSLKEIKEQKALYNFSPVDLLTLSACSTGYANPEADGRDIDSLAKITSDRGARATLASLWPVADASTALLMQRFYELKEIGKMSKIHALSVVQREFIHHELGSAEDLAGTSVVVTMVPKVGMRMKYGSSGGLDLPFSHPYFWAPFVLAGNWR